MSTMHISWDYGAVSSLFLNVLKPKTRKTLCGRQTTFRNTTDCVEAADCPACLEKHKEWQASAALLERIRRP
jgi:hypothetical protein